MKGKIFWGLAFIAIALLLILDAVGVLAPVTDMIGGVTFWQIFVGVALLCGVVAVIWSGEPWTCFVLLGFIFMIFERNIAYVCGFENEDIINNWLVFGCSLLLSAGFGMLFSGFKKKRSKKEHFEKNIKVNVSGIGDSEVYIDCSEFGTSYMEHKVENKIGGVEVRFENVDEYRGGATLRVENKIGDMEVYVPRNWNLKNDVDVTCGAIEVDEQDAEISPDAPVLHLVGRVNIGAIEIMRV